ncbi:MAG: hypothetical protein LBV43_09185 [Prevotella sp.]|jgi:hypothetical protein|nr:hypothetical protein [Prevotella sp.]
MINFEKIYGISFENLAKKINKQLERKYSEPITIDWEVFTKDCIDPQPDDWLVVYDKNNAGEVMTKKVGNIEFIIFSFIDVDVRNEIVEKTKDYIAQNLELINESELESSIQLILVQNREEVKKFTGNRLGGMAHFNSQEGIHSITSVFNDTVNVLKHELMHAVSVEKWGEYGSNLLWLTEGLAVFAAPDTEECTGYTLEERYAYLLQNNRLLDISELIAFPWTRTSYSQAGYIVKYLIERFGVEKLKLFWQSGMDNFEKVYGLKYEEMISEINSELNKKYSSPIGLEWKTFNKDCIENID